MMRQSIALTQAPIVLSNGLEIYEMEKGSAEMTLTQVKEYFRHGIQSFLERENPVVVDIGANIGLFALEVFQRTTGNVRIFCYEPIPDTFKVLARNLGNRNEASIVLINKGVGAREEMRRFFFNPRVSLISTMYEMNLDVTVDRVLSMVYDTRLDDSFSKSVPPFLQLIPYPILEQILKIFVFFLKWRTRSIHCQVERLSNLIERERLTHIDLLKIDVEKAEFDVLEGIDENHWPVIKAITMEIHDQQGRLENIRNLLKEKSFSKIFVEQETFYEGSDVYSLWAWRTHH